MKQLLTSFAVYDQWANEKLLAVIVPLPIAKQQQEINSSFPSIHKTCLHIWDASSIWWQRLQKYETIVRPVDKTYASAKEIASGLLQQNELWVDWIKNASEDELASSLAYRNLKGDPFVQPVKDIVLHLLNHTTYHRGQLVTMLRQVGVEQIPQTDYHIFSRLDQ